MALSFLEFLLLPALYGEFSGLRRYDWCNIQVASDREGGNGMFVLTGSNQPLLSEAVSQTLAGRTTIFRLLPLSLEELDAVGIRPSRDECLVTGFLPRVHKEKQDPGEAYRNYLETYVERDLRQLINVKDLSAFHVFLKMLAGRVGQILNLHALADDIGYSSTTLAQWLVALEALFIVFRLRPFFANRGKRLVKSPKLYFIEPGLAASLLGIEVPSQVCRDPLFGGLFENMMIRRRVAYPTALLRHAA